MPRSRKIKQEPFHIKDCALAAIATGQRAQNLKELRYNIQQVEPESIEHHFWGGLLKPGFDDPEFNNDFASWVRHGLHDKVLAERLGVLNPVDYPDVEELRKELIEVIEERLDSLEHIPWCEPDEQFYFITSQVVVFDTHKVITMPEELVTTVPSLTTSSIFYHFIEARRRTFGNLDDFRSWLYGFGEMYNDLIGLLSAIDPFFSSLTDLRKQLSDLFAGYFEEAGR
jgi:hypothetical protein